VPKLRAGGAWAAPVLLSTIRKKCKEDENVRCSNNQGHGRELRLKGHAGRYGNAMHPFHQGVHGPIGMVLYHNRSAILCLCLRPKENY